MSRAYCYRCQRVEDDCICQHITRIDNPLSVCVLQHPDEARQTKGTEIIARLSLENYHCLQGENFSEHDQLNKLINSNPETICVVYPSDSAVSVTEFLVSEDDIKSKVKYLIFIDATWRKAKKIWALSSNLHGLKTLKLNMDRKSDYRIRKVPADGYLSTVEAIAYCLSDFDGNSDRYQGMLSSFKVMIDKQIENMGQDVYESNYDNADSNEDL